MDLRFRGTYKYSSVRAHHGMDHGRVDDLWGWCDIFVMRVIYVYK
jgi:hypothetical protein